MQSSHAHRAHTYAVPPLVHSHPPCIFLKSSLWHYLCERRVCIYLTVLQAGEKKSVGLGRGGRARLFDICRSLEKYDRVHSSQKGVVARNFPQHSRHYVVFVNRQCCNRRITFFAASTHYNGTVSVRFILIIVLLDNNSLFLTPSLPYHPPDTDNCLPGSSSYQWKIDIHVCFSLGLCTCKKRDIQRHCPHQNAERPVYNAVLKKVFVGICWQTVECTKKGRVEYQNRLKEILTCIIHLPQQCVFFCHTWCRLWKQAAVLMKRKNVWRFVHLSCASLPAILMWAPFVQFNHTPTLNILNALSFWYSAVVIHLPFSLCVTGSVFVD